MKPSIKFLAVVIAMLTMNALNNVYGQATDASNVRAGGRFLGWNNTTGTPGSLEIRNNFTHSINFFTDSIQRAKIDSLGNVGIGTSTPAVRLDVAQTAINNAIGIDGVNILPPNLAQASRSSVRLDAQLSKRPLHAQALER